MKLFYTEDEAIEELIQFDGQEYALSIYELDSFVPVHSGIQKVPHIKSQYIKKEIIMKDKTKIYYVLENFEEEVYKMIIKAFNEK